MIAHVSGVNLADFLQDRRAAIKASEKKDKRRWQRQIEKSMKETLLNQGYDEKTAMSCIRRD